MMELAGGVAVITGAGSGLGAAMANALAREGMNVALLDIDDANAASVAASIREGGGLAASHAVDVGDPHSIGDAAAFVRDEFGSCNLVGANVGVQQFGAIDRLTDEDWQWVLTVNVLGTVRTVGAFLPLLRETPGDRRILLTASAGVFTPGVRLGAYATTKYAVVAFGEALHLELEPEGIGVSILFPAGMATRHLESSMAARPDDLGPSVLRPDDIDAMLASREYDASADTIDPELAIRNLVRDLRDDRHYIFTHGRYRHVLERRAHDIVEAYDRMAADYADDSIPLIQ